MELLPRYRRPRVAWNGRIGLRRVALPTLVVGGLTASGAVAGSLGAPSPDGLPGIALGSTTILLVERVLALFGAWLVVLTVVARALAGELPTELSGRGLRYADAAAAERSLTELKSALDRMEDQVARLRALAFGLHGGARVPSDTDDML